MLIVTSDRVLFVWNIWTVGREQLFLIVVHCLQKNSLKILAFSKKIVTSWSLADSGGIIGTFLTLTNVLSIDQLVLGEVLELFRVLVSRK